MLRKISAAIAVVMLSALTFTGCAGSVRANNINNVSGKGFVYEKDGFPDKFGIKLYNDGSFTYYAGMFSSHVGYEEWSLDGDTLTLKENADSSGKSNTFRFEVGGDALSYIAEGSDNFMHVKVSDGEKFKEEELSGFPF